MGGRGESGKGNGSVEPAVTPANGAPDRPPPGDGKATGVLAASPPSIQRVFPPLLVPPEPAPVSVARRRSLRLLVALVVLAVATGLVASAVVLWGLVTRSEDDAETVQPAARQAAPRAAGPVVETEALSGVLEERPTDGRLHGLARHVDVVAYGYTDRVRLAQPGRPHGETVEAADGEHWLVVEIDSSNPVGVGPTSGAEPAPTTVSLVVDGESTPLPLDGPGTVAFSVPTDAGAIDLVTADANLTQSWSFVSERRSATSPDVLYETLDRRATRLDGRYSLPYGATSPLDMPPQDLGAAGTAPGVDLSTAFGEHRLTMTVGEARLSYAVGVTTDGAPGFHTASGPDRALFYLMGVNADWGGAALSTHVGYSIEPEDAVLTLPDGTTVTATPLAQGADSSTVVHDLDDGLPLFFGIFDGALVWDVPAGLQRATLTIRPSPGTTPTMGNRIDFQGGAIEIEIDFSSP